MCKAFDDYKKEGKREGKREGMQEMAIEMIRNLMKNQKVSFEVAAEMTGISKGKQKQLKSLIQLTKMKKDGLVVKMCHIAQVLEEEVMKLGW